MMVLIFMIFIGFSLGWIVSGILLKLLFRPYNEVTVLFFKVQGWIPKKRKEIALNIALLVEEKLFSSKDLLSKIKPEEVEFQLDLIIEEIFKEDSSKENKGLAYIVKRRLKDKIKSYAKKLIGEKREALLNCLRSAIMDNVNIGEIIEYKINSLSTEDIENIFRELIFDKFKVIKIYSGILGGILGLLEFIFVKYVIV